MICLGGNGWNDWRNVCSLPHKPNNLWLVLYFRMRLCDLRSRFRAGESPLFHTALLANEIMEELIIKKEYKITNSWVSVTWLWWRTKCEYRWRAGSKNGGYVYGGNCCRESLLYGFRASFETKIQTINQQICWTWPYLMKMSDFSTELKDLPTIEAVDITNCLVLQTSYYTKQQMKAYKSIEAYNLI